MSPPPEASSPVGPNHKQHRLNTYIRKLGSALRKRSFDRTSTTEQSQHVPEPSGSLTARSSRSITIPTIASLTQANTEGCPGPSTVQARAGSVSNASSHSGASTTRRSITSGLSVATTIDRQAAREERARNLFAKYGLKMDTTIQPATTSSLPDPLLRVQKRPRLRMHTICHVCDTNLGMSTHCNRCGHRRCRDCPRSAPKGVQALVDQTKKDLIAFQEADEAASKTAFPDKKDPTLATKVPDLSNLNSDEQHTNMTGPDSERIDSAAGPKALGLNDSPTNEAPVSLPVRKRMFGRYAYRTANTFTPPLIKPLHPFPCCIY